MLTVQNLSHDPFYNQAFEEYIYQTYQDDDIFLLWQNSPAVVVGSYQNICREVHVEALRQRGIPVVRRISGGGTGYHDLGNVNYTYIIRTNGALDYDAVLSPVIAALNANGAVFTQDTAGKNGGYPVLWFETQPRTEVCQITQTAAANGTFTVSRTGEAAFGTSVSLTAQPDAGYRLAYFTANGAPILGGYYMLTGDTALAAVFQKLKTATITVPEYDAFYLAAARTG